MHLKSIPRKIVLTLAAVTFLTSSAFSAHWTSGMHEGNPTFKSMGPLTFGPEGILFVADTKAAKVIAIALNDKPAGSTDKPLKVEKINQKIAGLLGAAIEDILINDLAVNPVSRHAYLAIGRGRGPNAIPVLVRATTAGDVEVVSLQNVTFSEAELPDAPVDGVVGSGNRQSNPRHESITDIAFLEDRLLIAGLSNEEFASTLRAIPFPFQTVPNGTSVEIYHGAHGRFETRSPIRTFVPFKVGTESHLLAAYTCTPLVQFPVNQLQPGAKIKGKTIAELGNRNRPLDMIVYQKEGKDYLLLANNSRGMMRINADQIEKAGSIAAPVKDGKIEGLNYETLEGWTGVDQLDRLDAGHALVVRRSENGSLNLETFTLP